MTRPIDHEAADQIVLNDESFDVACQAGNEAARAGLEPQEELSLCIRSYIRAEQERLSKPRADWLDPIVAQPTEASVGGEDAVREAFLAASPWIRTSERLPCTNYGEQRDVIFGSTAWGWPIVGMYTHWDDQALKTECCPWSMYDQVNDRFVDWWDPGMTPNPPEFWMYRPKLPGHTD